MNFHRNTTFVVVASLAFASTAFAQWPQWRGANRDGHATEFSVPEKLPQTLTKVWELEVGVGHSAPIVEGGAIYQFSRVGEEETLRRLGRDGREAWKVGYEAPYKMHNAARGHGKGPKSTPAVAGGRIYTLGIDGAFQCRHVDSGKLVWQADVSRFAKKSPLYGAAASPLVAKDKLALIHLGGHNGGAMTAFDAATGKPAWTWKKDGPAYTSPVIMSLTGVPQMVTQTQQQVLAYSPDGKVLWQAEYKTPYDQNSVTPLQYKDTVIISGTRQGIAALRISKTASGLTADEVWHNGDQSMYMSSPVLVGDRLFGFSEKNRGQLFCASAETGEVIWLGPPRQGENASLVVAGDHVLALFTTGKLVAFSHHGQKYVPVGEHQVADSPVWAHLVMFDDKLLVKDETKLTMWRW